MASSIIAATQAEVGNSTAHFMFQVDWEGSLMEKESKDRPAIRKTACWTPSMKKQIR
ncbi:hypothetical protein D3C76_1492220 [compost metagenome]